MQMLLSKCISILITLTLMLSLTGCYEVEKIINKGTVKGVSLCIDHNTSSLLSEELVKRKCIKENQSKLKYRFLNDASARVIISSKIDKYEGEISLAGGTNEYDDYIITEILLEITVFDADGEKYVMPEVIETWIEPSKKLIGVTKITKFGLPANTSSEEINENVCPEKDMKSCANWSIIRISGVKI